MSILTIICGLLWSFLVYLCLWTLGFLRANPQIRRRFRSFPSWNRLAWGYGYIYIYISCTVSHDDGDRLCWRVAVGSSLGSVPENGVPGTRKKAPTWESISGMLRFWYWSLEHVRTVKTSKRCWFSYVSIIIIIITTTTIIIIIIIIYIVIHYPPTLQ